MSPPLDDFEPKPVHAVCTPEELKAFTDPLRNQILGVLARQVATNRQLAALLGQPEAKVLYHLRVLVRQGMVRLVGTNVKGGNVEKYYRAVARLFSVRPGPEMLPDLVNSGLEVARREVGASVAAWPDQPRLFESRTKRVSAARAAEFAMRMRALIREYWEDGEDDPESPLLAFVALTYRDPADASVPGGDRG